MFIYLVAITATLFIIFGLVHARCLNDWVRSSVHYPLSLYHGLIRRPMIEASLTNEDTENPGRFVTMDIDRPGYEDFISQRTAFAGKERSFDAGLGEAVGRPRNLNAQRFSFENMLSDDNDKDLRLPGMRNLQPGITREDTIKASKQEGVENIFESLRNSIKKSTVPTSRLNPSQIHQLILKEAMKENAAKQVLMESGRSKLESAIKTLDHLPSSSEDSPERDDDAAKSSKSNLLNY